MISRYLLIVLALGATAMRVAQGAWIEASGLGGLAGGLIALQLARRRPSLRIVAWCGFAVTAGAMAIILLRMRAGS